MFLRTNFGKDQIKRYEVAVNEYHKQFESFVNRLHIIDKAHDRLGRVVENNSALYDTEHNKDLGDFWKIFDSLDDDGKSLN